MPLPGPPPLPGPAHGHQRRGKGWLIALAVGGVLLLVTIIGALTPSDDPAPKASSSSAAKSPPKTAKKAAQAPSPSGARPIEDRLISLARQQAFTAALTRIDPGLTVHPRRHLWRALNVCQDVYKHVPAAAVLRNTATRYDGGNASVPQGSAKAQKILAAVRRYICSSPQVRAHYR